MCLTLGYAEIRQIVKSWIAFLQPHNELTVEQQSQWLQNKTSSLLWHGASVPSKVSIPIFFCLK